MFIDETGNSSGKSPFTVTGVIMEYKYSVNSNGKDSILKQKLKEFKKNCFGREDIHLHLKQILTAESPFSTADGVTVDQLKKFWTELPVFLNGLDFHIISVTVDKDKLKQYYLTPKDPYSVAFAHILEAFYSFISLHDAFSARIVIESRDDYQNLLVQKAFFDIFNAGTVHLNVRDNSDKIKGFIFAEKTNPLYQSGLEIADLVCNPLSRVRRGLIEVIPRHVNYGDDNPIFASIKNKIFIGHPSHDFRNWGFKKVPIVKKARPWETKVVKKANKVLEA
jgi:Protein of unknown function (DUF3800)